MVEKKKGKTVQPRTNTAAKAKKEPKKPSDKRTPSPASAALNGSSEPFKETIIKKLRCTITEKRELEILREMKQTDDEIAVISADRKKAVNEFDEKLKACKGHRSKLDDTLESGEIQPVKVDVVYDFSKRTVTETRQDTGETSTRIMTEEDKVKAQGNLALEATQQQAVDTMAAAKDRGEDAMEAATRPTTEGEDL